MTFHCWVVRRWVFEAWYREYPTRNLELGIPAAGYSRCWVFRTRTGNTAHLRVEILLPCKLCSLDNKYVLNCNFRLGQPLSLFPLIRQILIHINPVQCYILYSPSIINYNFYSRRPC